jgi:hypothetical protein
MNVINYSITLFFQVYIMGIDCSSSLYFEINNLKSFIIIKTCKNTICEKEVLKT